MEKMFHIPPLNGEKISGKPENVRYTTPLTGNISSISINYCVGLLERALIKSDKSNESLKEKIHTDFVIYIFRRNHVKMISFDTLVLE